MSAKFVICLALCALSTVSAGVLPLAAAPLAATGVVAPYATSYNAHTINHAIAAPYVAAAAPYVAAPAAKLLAAPAPLAYSAYGAALPAFSPYTALPASYVL
ncbi:AAEL017397-PA [Aedes aegypti]|uniref:AAEL017397-PA n=2 Tax=Aedes aegypti TaxID=7159 RepID=A0A1S4G6N9_AEDAE|nr:cuticle protein 16.5 [Aedes aegypti]EJY57392.1 AAEL017397-PA [Aedes aegypti]